jgi:hypothetical protein
MDESSCEEQEEYEVIGTRVASAGYGGGSCFQEMPDDQESWYLSQRVAKVD